MKGIFFKWSLGSIVLCLMFSACNSNQGSIEGKWVLSKSSGIAIKDPNNYLLLNPDGSAIENSGSGESQKTWTVQEGELCIRALDSDGGIQTCGEYELKGDVLVLEMNDLGVKLEYQRQK